MGWTVNFFAHKASTWLRWAEKANSQQRRGHECYARRQHAFWMTMKQNATHIFQRAIQVVTKDASVQIPGLQADMELADPELQPGSDRPGSSNNSYTAGPSGYALGSMHDVGPGDIDSENGSSGSGDNTPDAW